MPELYKPTVAELELLRNEATRNGKVSETEWVDRCCRESARILRKDPLRYRSYGPYWWVQKQAMLAGGITDFGEFVDMEWHDAVDYGSRFLNLLAALIYSNGAMDSGLIYSNSHNVIIKSENTGALDAQVYVLSDDDMELLAIRKHH